MIGETVTVLTPGETTDGHGNPVPDWADAEDTDVEGAAVAPEKVEEDRTAGRQGVVVKRTVYLPPGSVVAATDRLVVRGDTYNVDGEPGPWVSPFGGTLGGVEVSLRRVVG